MSSPNQADAARTSFVAVVLTSGATLFVLLLLIFLTGGFILYELLVAASIIAFGAFHYFLWGRLLSQQTAGEREEEQLRQRALADDAEDSSR